MSEKTMLMCDWIRPVALYHAGPDIDGHSWAMRDLAIAAHDA